MDRSIFTLEISSLRSGVISTGPFRVRRKLERSRSVSMAPLV